MRQNILNGKVAVVTGASRGIGRQIALAFAEEGADLVANATKLPLLQSLADEVERLGRRCIVVQGEIDKPQTSLRIVKEAMGAFGKIDVLVNNAGIMNRKKTLDLTLEEWQRLMDVNANGVFYMCKAVLPVMVKQHSGNVINITSTASKAAHPNACPAYGASKAAVTYLTKHFAAEFGKDGIRVNALQCGPIHSEMTDQWTPEYRSSLLQKIPVGRIGEPEDVAAAAVYMASDLASFVSGCSFNLSGGKFME